MNELTDHILQRFAFLGLILTAGLLLPVQARDRDQVTLPDDDRARVNRVVEADRDFDRNIAQEKLESLPVIPAPDKITERPAAPKILALVPDSGTASETQIAPPTAKAAAASRSSRK